MNAKNTTKVPDTDWERIASMKDEDIDTSDIPELDEHFFANAKWRMPAKKESITIRLDPEILAWFRATGKGYQTRINSILRMYVEAQNS